MKTELIKLTEAAKRLGVNPWTLRRKLYAGKIPFKRSDTGHNFIPSWWIDQQTGDMPASNDVRCAIYARESSSENKSALASQLDGLKRYAQAKGYAIQHVVTEFGSGVNDSRKKLESLLRKKDFDMLLVEHKDRLTRFGFNWFTVLCPFRVEVVNHAENDTHDLMDDLVAVLHTYLPFIDISSRL
jgi:predicted site-specific integrase-resolvase